jgi:hypothetical protein
MKPPPTQLIWGRQKARDAEEVLVHGVSGCDCIEADDARRLNLIILYVALLTKLLGRECFLLQPGRVDQLVAPEAAKAWPDWPNGTEDVGGGAVLVDLDFAPT